MPIYEYQCPNCRHTFEEWVRLADAHGQEPCPKCGAPSPRIMSHTSFVLKGGGWYVSDYGYRKGVKEDGAPSAAGAASSETASSRTSASAPDAGNKGASAPSAATVPAAGPAPKARAAGAAS